MATVYRLMQRPTEPRNGYLNKLICVGPRLEEMANVRDGMTRYWHQERKLTDRWFQLIRIER